MSEENVVALTPDFECKGCGFEVFGREPVHCPKCRGTDFVKTSKSLAGMDSVLAVLERIRRDSRDVRVVLRKMKSMRFTSKVLKQMHNLEACANTSIAAITKAPNPAATHYPWDSAKPR